jgi:hypothetical protein
MRGKGISDADHGLIGVPVNIRSLPAGAIALAVRGNAMLVIATYHELRVIKEGVDTEQIAAVFE